MTEDSITRRLEKGLREKLGRFVLKLNEDPGTGTGTAPAISTLDKGWTYPAQETVRERYERECI